MAATSDNEAEIVEKESNENASDVGRPELAPVIEAKTPDLAQAGNDGLIEAEPTNDFDQLEPADEQLQGVTLDEELASAAEGVAQVEDLDVFNSLAPDSDASASGEANDPFADSDTTDGEFGLPGTDGESVEAQAGHESGLIGEPAPTADIGRPDAGGEADSTLFGSPDAVEQAADQQGEVTFTDPRVGTEDESPWDDMPKGPPPDEGPPPPPDPKPDDPEASSRPVDTGIDIGEIEPLDFSPPEELINPSEPTIPGGTEMDARPVNLGDGIIDPRTVNPAPDGEEPAAGGDDAGGGLIGEGVVDPVDSGPFAGGLMQPESDDFGAQREDDNDLDIFDLLTD